MGGCTITRTNVDIDLLINGIKEEIVKGALYGLYADSKLILLKPSTKETRLFEIVYEGQHGETVTLKECSLDENIGHGGGMAISFSSIYGDKPKENEWVGMVHLHT